VSASERGFAAQRAAETLLQTLGGISVKLQLPMREIALTPVVFRSIPNQDRSECLIAAATLEREAGCKGSVDSLHVFNDTLHLTHRNGGEWRIDSVDVDEFGGLPYLYRVKLSKKSQNLVT
jgi:hypothetical protein